MKEMYSLEVRLSRQEDGLWRAEVPALKAVLLMLTRSKRC